ncbi:MAG: cytochrome c oxidase assembly protein [Gemmobacter sp.]
MAGPKLSSQQATALRLTGVAVLMASLSFAAVPFYDWFCRVTGFGGTTGVSVAAPGAVLDRTMRVRFDASKDRDMPWEFRPAQREMEIRIGEVGLAFYEAYNPTDKPIAGTASYNVAPFSAGGYFAKIDCFCFEMQVLQPGERMMMPVTFYIDPEIVDHREAKYLRQITLSYTFHKTDIPEDTAALAPQGPRAVAN